MSLDKPSSDSGSNATKRNYDWPRAKKRAFEYEDEQIMRDAQHIRIRERLGEDISDSDRHVLNMARRIQNRRNLAVYRKTKREVKDE